MVFRRQQIQRSKGRRSLALDLAAKAGKRLARRIQRIHRLAHFVADRKLAGSLTCALAPKLAVAEMLLRTLDGKAFVVKKVTNPLQKRQNKQFKLN